MQGVAGTDQLALMNTDGLERSCGSRFREGMRITVAPCGVERMEARFRGVGFSSHRHDTYAMGLTLHGVQAFRYRGAQRFSRPGNIIVLHPDEAHDGAAGNDHGLIYRMIYLPPERIVAACDTHRTLPFVADPVLSDRALWRALVDILGDLNGEISDLLMDDVVLRLAAGLSRLASIPRRVIKTTARTAVLRACDFMESHCVDTIRSEELERITGLGRYELARQFRSVLGTSPHRFLVMRRLKRAKRLLADGGTLANVATDAGFADQAHLTRHFRNAFGMTPGRWVMLQKDIRQPSIGSPSG